MSDIDACLSCEFGSPSDESLNLRLGFCETCQDSGRAELYLSLLAFQDGDLEEAYGLFRKALARGLGEDDP